MLRKISTFLLSFGIYSFVFYHTSIADSRSYVWNYEYLIIEKGKTELENYLTITTPDMNKFKGNTTTTLNLEYEIGMTEHFDFAIYHIFKQIPSQPLVYDGFKFRARYKIGEKNEFFVDPLIYFEYSGKPDFSEHEFEFKLILSKDFGKFNIIFNPIIEFAYEDEEWDKIFGYTFGAKYQFWNLLSGGMEAMGDEYGNYIGPVISHGNNKAWFALGSLFKIGKVMNNGPEFHIRLLTGFEL